MAKMLATILSGSNEEIDKWFCDDNPEHQVLTIDVENPALDFMQRCIDAGIPLKIYRSDFGKDTCTAEKSMFAYRSCDDAVVTQIVQGIREERLRDEKNMLDAQTQTVFDGIKTNILGGLSRDQVYVLQKELSAHQITSFKTRDPETGMYSLEVSHNDLAHEYITEDGKHKMVPLEEAFADAFVKMENETYMGLIYHLNKTNDKIDTNISAHLKEGTNAPVHVIYNRMIPGERYELVGNMAIEYKDDAAPGEKKEDKKVREYNLLDAEQFAEFKSAIFKTDEGPGALFGTTSLENFENKKFREEVIDYEASHLNETPSWVSPMGQEIEENVCKPLREKGLIDIDYRADVDPGKDIDAATRDDVTWSAKEVRLDDSDEVVELMLKTDIKRKEAIDAAVNEKTKEQITVSNENGSTTVIQDEDLVRQVREEIDRHVRSDYYRKYHDELLDKMDDLNFDETKRHEHVIGVDDPYQEPGKETMTIGDNTEMKESVREMQGEGITENLDGTISVDGEKVDQVQEEFHKKLDNIDTQLAEVGEDMAYEMYGEFPPDVYPSNEIGDEEHDLDR
jgi:hypothetical protein